MELSPLKEAQLRRQEVYEKLQQQREDAVRQQRSAEIDSAVGKQERVMLGDSSSLNREDSPIRSPLLTGYFDRMIDEDLPPSRVRLLSHRATSHSKYVMVKRISIVLIIASIIVFVYMGFRE